MHISNAIGAKPEYIQGGGGNVSAKIDNSRMVIKASGEYCKQLTLDKGYCIVDYVAIRNYLREPDQSENTFTKKIKSFVTDTNNRPSIETGFHAQLGKFVVHTHSIYVNILACAREGKAVLKELFPSMLWIEYSTPGLDLNLAIQKAFSFSKKTNIIFLQNHGIIVVSENAKNALSTHEEINKKIKDFLNLDAAIYKDPIIDSDYVKHNVLFPDQVIYTLSNESILETTAAKETLWAYDFILKSIKKINFTPQFISQEKVNILLNMEGEKFRQKVLEKNELY